MPAFLVFAAAFALVVGITALEAYVVMLVWNFVAAHFGLPTITFWVAAAVLFLVNLLKPSSSSQKAAA